MATVQAFRGWRYDPGMVDYAKVMAPPYDVISPEMQDELYNQDDRNVVRLIYGKIFDTDSEQDNRYTRAATHLDAWRSEGLFLQDKPSIYLYEQEWDVDGRHLCRRGFFARVLVAPWCEQGVFPHEKTLAGPKVDRLDLMRAVRGNTGPVFGLLTDDDGAVSKILSEAAPYEPVCDFNDEHGVRNRMWVVDHEERCKALEALAADRQIFIADGHHRYETALAYRDEVRQKMKDAGQTPPPLGELDSDYLLMYIVADSDEGLEIWPTHRLVHDVANFSEQQLIDGCREHFDVQQVEDANAMQAGIDAAGAPCFGIVLPDAFWLVTLKNADSMTARAPDKPQTWRELDVSILHLLILEDLLGIDQEKLLRKENIIYTRSFSEAIEMSQNGTDGVQAGFVMRSTLMEQVRDVARAGEVMPQKSTYFYPKVMSGMVLHLFW